MIKTGGSKGGLRTKNANFMGLVTEKVIDNVMKDAKKIVQKETPKDTGLARRSWRLKNERKLSNKVPYILELEDGHSTKARDGISEPSLKKIKSKYKKGTYDE